MPTPATDTDLCAPHLTDPSQVAAVRGAALPAPVVERLASTFRALADPTRLRLVRALASNELCVHDLAAVVELSMSAVSHQLRLLRELRLVRPRRDGQHVFYALDDDHVLRLLALAAEHVEEG